MILSDQPTIFGEAIIAAVSSVEDGNMKLGLADAKEVCDNRQRFLTGLGIDPSYTTLLAMTYDTTDFTRYVVLDEDSQGEGIIDTPTFEADAAVVTRPGHAVFLPLADCAGMIVYDPENEIMLVAHLGRHNVEQYGATRSIEYMVREFDSRPDQLLVWLSPMVGSETYPLHAFENRGLQEVIVEQLVRAGVGTERIEMSPTDTAESDEYFSHSEYLAGNRLSDGRFAIVAMMRE